MKLSSAQYAQALHEAIHQTNPKDIEVVMDNFVKVLKQSGDLERFPEIEDVYRKLDQESKGIHQAHVTVAHDIEMNKGIMDDLNKIAGEKLEVTTKVDNEIIGGVIVKVDDMLIDASVKGQLHKLNNSLKNN